jgi:methylglutaconyl-CoA hydratase
MSGQATTPHLALTIAGPVATITFARPQKSNAYDKPMLRAFDAHLKRAGDDAAIRVVVLRGEGKHFSAGADLGAEEAQADEPAPGVAEVCLRLSDLPKPTVAFVQGACIGGSMAFVACCDIVIAARDAFFSLPEARIGFSPTPLIAFVMRAVGERHARRILMSGARFSADEALRMGLVSEICEAGMMEQTLADTIARLLQSAPGAVATIKTQVASLRQRAPTPELLAELQRGFDAAWNSTEAEEGRAARREKRPPNWAVKPGERS